MGNCCAAEEDDKVADGAVAREVEKEEESKPREPQKLDLSKFKNFGANVRQNEAARQKFNELDKNENGFLDPDECMLLSLWLWDQFHEGEQPSFDRIAEIRKSIIASTHKGQGDEEIRGMDWSDFSEWFKDYTKAMKALESDKGKTKRETRKALANAGDHSFDDREDLDEPKSGKKGRK